MDLTAKLFEEARFRVRMRGYDPDEVDAFLEQLVKAVDTVGQRLREAHERAERAEARAREHSEVDDELRRTLVLAQRTADAAIREANEQAAATVSEAERKAAALVAEARQEADRQRADAASQAASLVQSAESHAFELRERAEREALAAADEVRRRLRDEIAQLEQIRSTLRDDVEQLEGFLAGQRARLAATVEALLEVRDDPSLLRGATPPATAEVDVPEEVVPPTMRPGAREEAVHGGSPHEVLAAAGLAAPAPATRAVDEPEPVAAAEEDDGDPEDALDLTDAGLRSAEPGERPSEAGEPADREDVELVWADDGGEWDEGEDDHPPTEEVPVIRDEGGRTSELGDLDDEAYLAELRRAIVDPEPLGPRDHLDRLFYDQEYDVESR